MALPQEVMDALNENAQRAGVAAPGPDDDLFRSGVLDSFALIDFVTLIEEACAIKISDSDVNPANFQTLSTIENYVDSRKG